MSSTARAESFWVDDSGEPLVLARPKPVVRQQVGYNLVPRYTIQEYAAQARKMAEAHAAALSPEIRSMVGQEVMLAQLFEPMAMPAPLDDSPASGACFI